MPSQTEAEGMMGSEGSSGLPVDKGWSWVIMTGHFVMTLVMAGYGRALSLFLMEFVVMFESSVTAATLSYAVMTAAFGVGNVVVTHVLLPRFDTRHVILTGAASGAVAVMIASFAPGILLIVLLHVVIGFSHAMMHTSSATLMGPYFRARRGLANAVSNTGHSISALLLPPLTQFLIDSYGTRGAFLLVAGFQMQGIVAGFLMRPVEFYTHRKRKSGVQNCSGEIAVDARKRESLGGRSSVKGKGDVADVREEREGSTDIAEKDVLLGEKTLVPHPDPSLKVSAEGQGHLPRRQPPCVHHPSDVTDSDPAPVRTDNVLKRKQQQPPCIHHPSNATDIELAPVTTDNELQTDARGSLKSFSEPTDVSKPETESPVGSSPAFISQGDCVRFVTTKDFQNGETANHVLEGEDRELVPVAEKGSEVTDTSSKSPARPENCGCQLSAQHLEACEGSRLPDSDVSIHVAPLVSFSEESAQSVDPSKGRACCSACVSVTSKVVDVSLLRNWCFLLIMTYFPFGQTNAFLAIFLPALGVERGLSHTQAALLLTVMGGVDLCSRLLMGMLADTGLVRRTRIVAAALTFLSAACLFVGLYTDFAKLATFSVMFGLCGGTNQNMLVVVVVELLGLPHLRSTLGLALLVQSVCLSVTHPIMGALVDWTGSYVVVYYYVAGCLALAVFILLTEPLARKLESRRMRRMDES